MHWRRRAREYAVQVLFLWDSNGAADSELADRAVRGGALLEAREVNSSGAAGGGERGAGTVVIGGAGGEEAEARVEALDMARGAWVDREVNDKRLEFHAPQWPPKRQPGVDRAILRLAVWELGQVKTPPKVVIDEAIELARLYGTEQSPAFVNGVLDAIRKENEALKGPAAGAAAGTPAGQ